jgi:hypothetical protein
MAVVKEQKKQLETKAKPVIVSANQFRSKYFPAMNEKLQYKGMRVVNKPKDLPETATASHQFNNYGGIRVSDEIRLAESVQPPYTDADLQMFEAGARRNWAVKASLSVREHFNFGYGSELVVELAESEKVGLSDEQIDKKIKLLTEQHKDIIKKAYDRDTDVKLMKQIPTFWWQAVMHGRALIVKFFDNKQQDLKKSNNDVQSLKPINSRRLGIPIFNLDNHMEFEGVVVDGQGLSKNSMIYGAYKDVQLSPNTEGFGYSELESIVHVAEELNIAVEEDFKEILKSAWLASILFVINTAGMKEGDAKNKIQTIIDAIEPAKFIGINEDIQDFKQLDLNPDFNGLVQLVDNLETKIYKALSVPQFLVQSESIANRATALQSASLFINGVITKDQSWISDILQEQWYDPFIEKELKAKKLEKQTVVRKNTEFDFKDKSKPLKKGDRLKDDNSGFTEEGETKFRIRRIFNQAKVADFIDLADALSKLFAVGIWDTQKVNEELGTEEVTPRVIAEQEKQKEEMQNQFNQGQPQPKDMIKENVTNEATNLKSALASIDAKDLPKYKALLFKELFSKIASKK